MMTKIFRRGHHNFIRHGVGPYALSLSLSGLHDRLTGVHSYRPNAWRNN